MISYLFHIVQYHNCMKYLLFVQLVGKWHFFQQDKNVVAQGLPSASYFLRWKTPLRTVAHYIFPPVIIMWQMKTSHYFVYFIYIWKYRPNKSNVFSEKYNNLAYRWKRLSSMIGTKLLNTKKVATITQSLTM